MGERRESFFNASAVAQLLTGSTVHEHSHPKVSKDDLANGIRHLSEAVATLCARSDAHTAHAASQEKRVDILEATNGSLLSRVTDLETQLSELRRSSREELKREQRKHVEAASKAKDRMDKVEQEVDEHDREMQGLHRAQDRTQSAVQKLKLDASQALESAVTAINLCKANGLDADGAGPGSRRDREDREGGAVSAGVAAAVDTANIKLMSEQVFCQDVNVATGELSDELVPLAHVLKLFSREMTRSAAFRGATDDALLAVRTDVAKCALDADFCELGSEFANTCTNLDGLLRSLSQAGILAAAPHAGTRICDAVVEAPQADGNGGGTAAAAGAAAAGAAALTPAQAKSRETLGTTATGKKLLGIRAAFASGAPIGPYQVTRSVRDGAERFEAEVNAVYAELARTVAGVGQMKAELATKLDADGVDSKIEVKFDEVIDELDKAIASAGADEEEFKKAAQELQEMCALLSQSKANQSDVTDIYKRLELDSRMRDKVATLQGLVEAKLGREEANELVETRVAREELGAKLAMLHRRLKHEMDLAMDEKNGIKPWVVGTQIGPGGAHKHSDPLTCLSCNRKITPGQMDLLKRSPVAHNAAMNLNKLEAKGKNMRRKPDARDRRPNSPEAPIPKVASDASNNAAAGPVTLPKLSERPRTVAGTNLRRQLPTEPRTAAAPAPAPAAKPAEALYGTDAPAVGLRGPTAISAPGEVGASATQEGKEDHDQDPPQVLDKEGNPVIEQVKVKTFSFQ